MAADDAALSSSLLDLTVDGQETGSARADAVLPGGGGSGPVLLILSSACVAIHFESKLVCTT